MLKCDLCDSSFTLSHHLKAHIKNDHEGEGKLFKCNICRNTFVSRRKLKQHMENSHNKKENKTPSGYGTVINID